MHIHDNIVQDFGRDGINIKGAPNGVNRVHHNTVLRGSSLNDIEQNGSVRLSQNTRVDVTHNYLADNRGSGVSDVGNGGNLIANNVIVRPGSMFTSAHARGSGIHIDGSASHGPRVINNTIVSPTAHGIYISSRRSGSSIVRNNLIVSSGNATAISTGSGATVATNYSGILASVRFTNPGANDYSLQSSSPAVDSGTDARSLGVTDDNRNVARPRGSAYDIGAYEY